MGSEWTAFLLRLTQTITEQIGQASSLAADIDCAASFLWSPTRPGEKPPIRWLAYGRKSAGEGTPVDVKVPLATASLRWRVATLLGSAQLLDLSDARDQLGEPPGFILDAFAGQHRTRVARPSQRPVEITPGKLPPEPIRGRSDSDYAGMAQSILASSEWAAARGSDRSRRDRVLDQLMTRALDQAPPAQGGAPDPAAP